MKRSSVMLVALVAAAVGLWLSSPVSRPFRFHHENVMGTSMDLTVVATTAEAAQLAEASVLAQIARDAGILSGYDPTSEFSRWFRTRNQPMAVSPELFEVLSLFDGWRDRTEGALDPSAERITRVWKAAATRQILPDASALTSAVDDMRRRHWRLDPIAGTAEHLDDTPVLLNAFTKIYIVNRAVAAAMEARSVTGVVLNIGGDLVTRGNWTESVRVADPRDPAENGATIASLRLRDRAVATSGGYRRGFDIGGRHYSHIVDPRTGQPTGHVLSATVVASQAVDAGALATALCVLTPAEGLRVAAGVPGAEFLLVLASGERVESPGWRALDGASAARPSMPTPVATLHASEQTWNPAFELTISLELGRTFGRAKRPYVAIWIENAEKFPIRTLALWFDRTRWLPDLRAWSRAERRRATAEGTDITGSISSATRSAGVYSFKWDGKDQAGQAGEAGRIHGPDRGRA